MITERNLQPHFEFAKNLDFFSFKAISQIFQIKVNLKKDSQTYLEKTKKGTNLFINILKYNNNNNSNNKLNNK